MNLLFRWLILVLAVVASAYFIPGILIVGILPAVIAGAALALIHIIVRPILKILTLPINLVTFGIFSIVLNGIVFWFVSTLIVGFTVDNYLAAFTGSVIVSLLNWIADRAIA